MPQNLNRALVLAAETPQYFPGLAYFHKMMNANIFVLVDDLQFSKHTACNRCRLKTAKGGQWLTVPVRTKGRFGQKINAVEILAETGWRQKHWQTLIANYRQAAYFEKYAEALEGFFASREYYHLSDLNYALLTWLCGVLRCDCRLLRSAELPSPAGGSTRLISWSQELGCEHYYCAREELGFLELEQFAAAGVEVHSADSVPLKYHQLFGEFISDLSILDVLLNEGEDSRRIIEQMRSPRF